MKRLLNSTATAPFTPMSLRYPRCRNTVLSSSTSAGCTPSLCWMRLVSSPSPKPALVTPRRASSSATRARQPGSCSWNTQAVSSVASCTMWGPSDCSPCTKVGLDSVSNPQALAAARASQALSACSGVATRLMRSVPRRSKGSSRAIWSLSGVLRWAVREGGGGRWEGGDAVMDPLCRASLGTPLCPAKGIRCVYCSHRSQRLPALRRRGMSARWVKAFSQSPTVNASREASQPRRDKFRQVAQTLQALAQAVLFLHRQGGKVLGALAHLGVQAAQSLLQQAAGVLRVQGFFCGRRRGVLALGRERHEGDQRCLECWHAHDGGGGWGGGVPRRHNHIQGRRTRIAQIGNDGLQGLPLVAQLAQALEHLHQRRLPGGVECAGCPCSSPPPPSTISLALARIWWRQWASAARCRARPFRKCFGRPLAFIGVALVAGRAHCGASRRSPRSALDTVLRNSLCRVAHRVAMAARPASGPALSSSSSSQMRASFCCGVPRWAMTRPVSRANSTTPPLKAMSRVTRSISVP